VSDVLEQRLTTLASWYPAGHFNGLNPQDYINSLTASRFTWHAAHLEPNGLGSGGTMIRALVAESVMSDLERMIVEIVSSLAMHLAGFECEFWKKDWDSAGRVEANAASVTTEEQDRTAVQQARRSKVEEMILLLLTDGRRLRAEEISRHIKSGLDRTEVYLKGLEAAEVVGHFFGTDENFCPYTKWYLADKGQTYLVRNELIS
jgi:hypothetical protein